MCMKIAVGDWGMLKASASGYSRFRGENRQDISKPGLPGYPVAPG